jgi:hypothetical protein
VNSESFWDPCNVVITRKNTRNKFPSTDPQITGHNIYMYMLPTFSYQGLTQSTSFQCYLIMVDRTSRKHHLIGLHDYPSNSVITSINEFTAPCNHTVTVEHINIRKIKTDAGTQFTSSNFREACATANIELSIAAPNQQEQERTWYSLYTIADAMLFHTRIPPKFTYYSICYAI